MMLRPGVGDIVVSWLRIRKTTNRLSQPKAALHETIIDSAWKHDPSY